MATRIGVVGYGAIGRHHARNLANMEDVDFIGVADSSPISRSEAQLNGFNTFAEPEDLLSLGLDAVVISVPTAFHESVALNFIDASVAVFIEKPIADTVAAGQRIIDAARVAGVPIMVGYVERYNPAVIAARDFIREGNLGKLVSISTQRVGILPPRIKDANVLVDIGVHDIDAIAFITGTRLELLAVQGGRAVLDDRVDYATLLISAGDTTASVATNWITPVKRRKLAITGLRGHIEVDYMTQEAWFAPAHDYQPTSSYEGLVAEYKGAEMMPLPVHKGEPLRFELQAFIAGVSGGSLPDPRIALESLRIAEEATQRVDGLKVEVL